MATFSELVEDVRALIVQQLDPLSLLFLSLVDKSLFKAFYNGSAMAGSAPFEQAIKNGDARLARFCIDTLRMPKAKPHHLVELPSMAAYLAFAELFPTECPSYYSIGKALTWAQWERYEPQLRRLLSLDSPLALDMGTLHSFMRGLAVSGFIVHAPTLFPAFYHRETNRFMSKGKVGEHTEVLHDAFKNDQLGAFLFLVSQWHRSGRLPSNDPLLVIGHYFFESDHFRFDFKELLRGTRILRHFLALAELTSTPSKLVVDIVGVEGMHRFAGRAPFEVEGNPAAFKLCFPYFEREFPADKFHHLLLEWLHPAGYFGMGESINFILDHLADEELTKEVLRSVYYGKKRSFDAVRNRPGGKAAVAAAAKALFADEQWRPSDLVEDGHCDILDALERDGVPFPSDLAQRHLRQLWGCYSNDLALFEWLAKRGICTDYTALRPDELRRLRGDLFGYFNGAYNVVFGADKLAVCAMVLGHAFYNSAPSAFFSELREFIVSRAYLDRRIRLVEMTRVLAELWRRGNLATKSDVETLVRDLSTDGHAYVAFRRLAAELSCLR